MERIVFDYEPGSIINRGTLVRIAALMLARQSPDGTPRIVDIGCAIGETFRNGAVNVDIKSHEELKAEAKPHHGDIEIPNFVQADAENLPFKDKEFDVAVLSETLEHVNDPVKAIREARRVANFVIITVPNEYMWAPDKNPFQPVEKSGHLRRFTAETIFETAVKSDMRILSFIDWQYLGWAYFILIGM